MHDETDETIARIAAALRPLPDVDPSEKAGVLIAVAAERERVRMAKRRAARRWRWAGATGAVAAAGLVAAMWLPGPTARRAEVDTTVPRAAVTSAPLTGRVEARLTRDADGVALKTVQLVLRAPAARRVSVVGDFNAWDAHANEMTRDPASGLWSQTVALRPGRHVYAFVVDDSVWMRDPRSPEASDADFGRPGSVLFIGQP